MNPHYEIWTRQPTLGALLSVGYRGVATLLVIAPWLASSQVPVLWVIGLLLLAGVASVLTGRMLWMFARREDRNLPLALLAADSAIFGTIFVLLRWGTAADAAPSLGWVVMSGTVALWTSCRGWRAGIVASLLSVPVGLVPVWFGPVPMPTWIFVIGPVGHCLVAVAVAGLLQVAFLRGVEPSRELAFDYGTRLAHSRAQRMIHDTALQTLEAIALMAGAARAGAEEVNVQRIAEMAALEARQLRDVLGARGGPEDLRTALESVAAMTYPHHVDVRVVAAGLDDVAIPPAVVEALCAATREALVNVGKHAGVRTAAVRVAVEAGGIGVSVTDSGIGFDPARVIEGFGLRKSVRACIASVGGQVEVTSRPGAGTLVWLWVPVRAGASSLAPVRSASPVPTFPAGRKRHPRGAGLHSKGRWDRPALSNPRDVAVRSID
ncbi:MAG: sensor histidine kinase [Nocardioides sp.]